MKDEYEKVKAENDWTLHQVVQYPDRLRAFCGVDPLKDYALAEIARCAKDPYLHFGLKLHFGNSDVDLDNAQHVIELRGVFKAANEHGMAIAVHLHSSITKQRAYGAKEGKSLSRRIAFLSSSHSRPDCASCWFRRIRSIHPTMKLFRCSWTQSRSGTRGWLMSTSISQE